MNKTIRTGGEVLHRARRRVLSTLALVPLLMLSACSNGGGGGSGPDDEAPTFSTSPQDVTAVEGQATTFSVVATGHPSPSIQWQVKLAGPNATWTNTGTNSTSHGFDAAAEQDGASYRAVATNSVGSATSSAAVLHVVARQVIEQQPQDQAWRPGDSEPLFTVTATGGSLEYQWQSSTDGGATFVDIDGATGASYVHKGAANDAVNAVRVTVSKLGFPIQSRTAKLSRLDWRPVTLASVGGQRLTDVTWLDASTAVAIGTGSAIILSSDKGATWRVVSERAAPETPFERLAFNADGIGIVVGGSTPMRSTDRGLHWSPVDPLIGPGSASAVAFGDASHVIALVGGDQIAYSTDAGIHWSPALIEGSLAAGSLTDVTMNVAGIGLAVGRDGKLLRSTDAGQHWVSVPTPNGPVVHLQRVTYASGTVAFAAGEFGGLLRSDDSGATWGWLMPFDFGTDQGFSDLKFRSPTEGVAVTYTGRVFTTQAGGQFWMDSGASGASAVAYSPSLSILAVGFAGNVRRSDDKGWTWQDLVANPWTWQTDLAFASSSIGIAAHKSGAIYRTTNGGADWSPVVSNMALMPTAAAFADSRTAVIVGTQWGMGPSIMRSTDGGLTWADAPGSPIAELFDIAFASPKVGTAAGRDGLYRTTDGGINWSPVLAGDARAVAFGSDSLGVALSAEGGALRTVDAGAHWTAVTTPIGSISQGHLAFADAQVVVAVSSDSTAGSIFRSADGGQTWSIVRPLTGAANEGRFKRVRFVSPMVGVAVGTRGALARTADGGLTWTDEPLPSGHWLTDVEFVGPDTVMTVDESGAILRNDSF